MTGLVSQIAVGAAQRFAADTGAASLSNTARRLAARLRGLVGKAIADYAMIGEGDRVMVCLSGGKDSYTLLDMLLSLQRSAPVRFELVAVNLDQKQPGFPADVLPGYLTALGVPFHVIEQDTYRVVKRVIPEGRTMCGLCSRLRRGALYRYASENGITRIALGHHRDDIVETLFLNMFYAGKLKTMPPKLLSADKRHIVIRPLAYVAERDIERYARARRVPDHSLQPVRLAAAPQATGRQGAAGRLGTRASGTDRGDLLGAAQCASVAPGGPVGVRFRRARCATHRSARRRSRGRRAVTRARALGG